MRIAPVSLSNTQHPSFNASLYVQSGSYAKSNEHSYESFQEVMDIFKKKLADDPVNPEDLVVVSPIKHDSAVRTSNGIVNANLKISIDDYSSNFYYDAKYPSNRIADDLYNTYKHVRYLRHYVK